MWLCEFIFNQAKLSGGGPTECILLLCIHKALLVLEQNSSFVLSELVMTSYSSPRPRRKSVHIFTMFFCSMFLNPSRDLEIFPQTSQEWEMLLDRVPVSVSEWLFGSFVLILNFGDDEYFSCFNCQISKEWDGNAVYLLLLCQNRDLTVDCRVMAILNMLPIEF